MIAWIKDFKSGKPMLVSEASRPSISFSYDPEAEAPLLWPPDAKSWLIGKDPDDGKDWSAKGEEGMAETEMVGWHHLLDRHEFEQILVKDKGAWHAAVHGVTKRRTWLSDWTTAMIQRQTEFCCCISSVCDWQKLRRNSCGMKEWRQWWKPEIPLWLWISDVFRIWK